jgi:predicted naringenin-chalcone synthase
MNNPIVRKVVAVVAGLVVAMLVVMIAEGAGHAIFPPPEGLDITKPEDQARLMEVIPLGAKIAVVVAWFLGATAGAATAMTLGKDAMPGWIVGLVLVALSLVTTQMFPHPLWMMVAAVALPLAGVLVAKRLALSRLAT